jgi:hypothetical protein
MGPSPAVVQFDPVDLFAFLTLIVAVSAYLATIRLFGIEKLRDLSEHQSRLNRSLTSASTGTELSEKGAELENAAKKKKRVKRWLALLLVADAPMTISAVLLGCYIFGIFNHPSGSLRLKWSIFLFTWAGFALSAAHAYAWFRSGWEIFPKGARSYITITSSPNRPKSGEKIKLTAQVTPRTQVISKCPTGILALFDGDDELDILPLIQGKVERDFSFKSGSHHIRAKYWGDKKFREQSMEPDFVLNVES